jgi:hypothetical protein
MICESANECRLKPQENCCDGLDGQIDAMGDVFYALTPAKIKPWKVQTINSYYQKKNC